jgi:hypothetical protein
MKSHSYSSRTQRGSSSRDLLQQFKWGLALLSEEGRREYLAWMQSKHLYLIGENTHLVHMLERHQQDHHE